MKQLKNQFTGHVSVNQRIYELDLCNIGTKEETLSINGTVFPEFLQVESDLLWENRRSVCIENCLVHFLNVNGEVTVSVEEPEEGRTSPGEKLQIPQYLYQSKIKSNETYLLKTEEQKDSYVREKLSSGFFALVFIGFFALWGASTQETTEEGVLYVVVYVVVLVISVVSGKLRIRR